MKRQLCLLLVFFALVVLAPPAFTLPGWMSVAVKKAALRTSPMPFAATIAKLDYGLRVDILEDNGLWYRVRTQNERQEGWVHSASLVDKRIRLTVGEQIDAAASEDELALGGKGFNAQVEAEYKRRDTGAAYEWVDWMEQLKIPASTMQQFMARGALQPKGVGDEK